MGMKQKVIVGHISYELFAISLINFNIAASLHNIFYNDILNQKRITENL